MLNAKLKLKVCNQIFELVGFMKEESKIWQVQTAFALMHFLFDV